MRLFDSTSSSPGGLSAAVDRLATLLAPDLRTGAAGRPGLFGATAGAADAAAAARCAACNAATFLAANCFAAACWTAPCLCCGFLCCGLLCCGLLCCGFLCCRLLVLPPAVLPPAVLRLAVLRLAVRRLFVLRLAALRLAVLRLAVLRHRQQLYPGLPVGSELEVDLLPDRVLEQRVFREHEGREPFSYREEPAEGEDALRGVGTLRFFGAGESPDPCTGSSDIKIPRSRPSAVPSPDPRHRRPSRWDR